MIRTAFLIGRILAALGAVLVVATVVVTVVSLSNSDNCQGADCDDVASNHIMTRAVVVLPIAVFVGAAGVALVHDTYRKI
jgi:hypothetical protein